jgi:hypothetical protein
MVVLLCNGRRQRLPNCLQIRNFEHTHTLHRSCHCWKHRRKVSFGILRNSAVTFDFMPSKVAKHVLLKFIFRVGNSRKSLGARSGDVGGRIMGRITVQQAKCGWMRYRDAENHCPCPPLVAPLPPSCIAQPLQNLRVEMTSNTLSRRCELTVHQTVSVKEFRESYDIGF